MSTQRVNLGLLAEHDEHWVAGALYIQTVVRALRSLPEASQPAIRLLLKQGMDPVHYGAIEDLVDAVDPFDRHRPRMFGGRFRYSRRFLLRNRRLPCWLEDRAARSEVSVMFPCLQAPGAGFPAPWIGWIPDFQHLHLPDLFDVELRKNRDRIYQDMIDESSHMVVSSRQARSDLLNHYRANSEQITVYSFRTHADPEWFEGDPKAVADAHGLPERFLMFPSQYWAHKDHLVLIEAMAAIKDAGCHDVHLVLSGKPEDFRQPGHPDVICRQIRERGLEAQVHQLGLLPRMEQVQLMRRACAIVQPSRFEGWSMLVEDCRALGRPMMLSDIPVHQEQAYAKTRYFPVGDAQALATLLSEQWPTLEPGPDVEGEAMAREENASLTLENGRLLMQLFEDVANR